jgi:quercetin 2,3-dioxygenase
MPRRLSRRTLLAATALPVAAGGAAFFVRAGSRTRDSRDVARVVEATPTRDGAGVKLSRILGGRALPMLDPFLLLDEFHSDRPEDWQAGFPSHPHRGFETVTIVLDGEVAHKDSVGNAGVIGAGAVQWMTAGKGIIHSEMPRAATPGGDLWGYQLWLNLPARSKMTAPRYQELSASAFPTADAGEARARVLAGRVGSSRGPIDGVLVDPLALDLAFAAGARLKQEVPRGHAALLYAVSGDLVVGPRATAVAAGHLAVLGDGDLLEARADRPARALLLAAQPIGEPVARRGPFVMNTDDEIRQAYDDYRSGRLTG